jgi:nucleoside-diphosphate-sugar epimerase
MTYTVLGATSIVAEWLCGRLAAQGAEVELVSRRPPAFPVPNGFRWREADLLAAEAWPSMPSGTVLSLVPLWMLPGLLPNLARAQQIVALSTTSVATKSRSPDPAEQALAQRVREAEIAIERWCSANDTAWTILRPTLIYSPWQDRNVSAIARFIQRYRFFVVARPATGLRQPVHADDVAAAMLACVGNPAARNKIFSLPGGETLAYGEMVRRIFAALGRPPVVLKLPPALLRSVAGALRLGRWGDYSPALFDRMNQDLVFDAGPARDALGFEPRRFVPVFPRAD